MSNNTTFTESDLEKMVAEHEAAAIRVKTIINELRVKSGLEPRYAPSELQQSSGGAFNFRDDQFHGRPLATCVREYLEMRRQSGLGPASSNEIYDALAKGAYEFGAKNEQVARVSTYNSINKNPVFYKLPNKKWGLREWYPNAKHQEQDGDDESSPKGDAVQSAEKAHSHKPSGRNGKPESVLSKIVSALSSDKNKQWSVDEIVATIPDAKKATVGALLFRLKRDNKAEKVGRGLWKSKT
jgi:hypothetical protein